MIRAGIALLLATAACGPSYDHMVFTTTTDPPATVEITSTSITLPQGIAVAVTAQPNSGSERLGDTVALSSSDSSIFGVASGNDGLFVLFGVASGSASLIIVDDGDMEPSIPVSVTAPVP